MKDILVLCPQERDFNAIRAAGLEQRYRVRFAGSDLDRLESFDPQAFLAEAEPIPAGAVVGTKDQSALLAALLAERRGLPGPSPMTLVRLQHKPTARSVQQRVAPEATPRFALLDSAAPFPYPFFVKPVVGPALAERLPDRRRARSPRAAEIAGKDTRATRTSSRSPGVDPATVHRLPRRGAARRRRGDGGGLRARRARDGDRRHRLAQVRGDPELRELRLPERAAAGAPRRARPT